MKFKTCAIVLAMIGMTIGGCAAREGSAGRVMRFGEPPAPREVREVPVQAILASAEQYDGQYLRVAGPVADVCAAKGCWLEMGDDGAEKVFVKFTCPIEGRLIPMEAVGKPTVVEGTLSVVMMSQDEARHYA